MVPFSLLLKKVYIGISKKKKVYYFLPIGGKQTVSLGQTLDNKSTRKKVHGFFIGGAGQKCVQQSLFNIFILKGGQTKYLLDKHGHTLNKRMQLVCFKSFNLGENFTELDASSIYDHKQELLSGE